ncbi:uncharacterized protein LOC143036384 isoform X2 [Oratosquilla oratoria]|uniref:uncharacterized protein LOC143036384 isoform X2 n=1 Tax=Oratosquilla oratoria TaxID=337810 RepID=UPI003F771A47
MDFGCFGSKKRMEENETSEDLQTLIRPEELEGIEEEEEQRHSQAPTLLHDNLTKTQTVMQCVGLVMVTTAMVVTLPVYLQAVNKSGDAYSALIFVSVFTALPITIYVQIRYSYFCQFLRLGPVSPCQVLKTGMFYGLSGVMIIYSLDRKRVLCHAQEPLMGLVVMYMIIIYFFYKGKELSPRKMLCLCGVLGGLLLAMDFQLNDIYMCHGNKRMSPADDGGNWSFEAHALWTIVYTVAIFLYTLSLLLLEKEVILKKPGSRSVTAVSTVSGGLTSNDAESLIGSRLSSTAPTSLTAIKWGMHLVWFCLAALATVGMLFWTDFFTALGKAGSPKDFVQLTSTGLGCHFQGFNEACSVTVLYGWIFLLSHIAFLVLVGCVLLQSRSMVYTLALASLSLPFSALWWAVFRIGGPYGMEWYPQVTGELVFSLLGMPVMVVCLMYWQHLDQEEKQRTNHLPMSATTA